MAWGLLASCLSFAIYRVTAVLISIVFSPYAKLSSQLHFFPWVPAGTLALSGCTYNGASRGNNKASVMMNFPNREPLVALQSHPLLAMY